MRLTEELFSIMVFAGVWTIWTVVFEPMYRDWLQAQGHAIGLGEIYVGAVIPALFASIFTWILLKRIRKHKETY